jgi:excisionase family DNA binding protein
MPRLHSQPAPRRALLTIQQAADEINNSPKSIRRWIAQGRLRAVRVGPRAIRIDRADLDQLITPAGRAESPDDLVERIARIVTGSPLSDDEIDQLARVLRAGATT